MSFINSVPGAAGALAIQDALIYGQNPAEIIELSGVIDLYAKEAHSASVDLTEYTVETGATLADGAAARPPVLILEGYVSGAAAVVDSVLVGQNRDVEAWQKLNDKMNKIEPVNVSTLLKVYKNMFIVHLDTRKSDKVPRGNLVVIITLKQGLIANTESTNLPDETTSGIANDNTSTINRGDVQAEGANATQQSSYFQKGIDFFHGGT
jgi:hypothetical protein